MAGPISLDSSSNFNLGYDPLCFFEREKNYITWTNHLIFHHDLRIRCDPHSSFLHNRVRWKSLSLLCKRSASYKYFFFLFISAADHWTKYVLVSFRKGDYEKWQGSFFSCLFAPDVPLVILILPFTSSFYSSSIFFLSLVEPLPKHELGEVGAQENAGEEQ